MTPQSRCTEYALQQYCPRDPLDGLVEMSHGVMLLGFLISELWELWSRTCRVLTGTARESWAMVRFCID